jgi:serine/threonine protein kinase
VRASELGQGAYGLVVSAQDEISGETIAIKMITRVLDKVVLARRALREITLLRHFASHENVRPGASFPPSRQQL